MDHFESSVRNGIELLTCRVLDDRRVPHAFTQKAETFGRREDGPRDRERLSRTLGLSRVFPMRQVHGSDVRSLEVASTEAPECDGLVTDQPGMGVVVQTADCVPFLVWAEHRNAVAAVHAGWRGSLSRVTGAAIEALASIGASPAELHVAVGPAIRVCCFEVGDEVIDAFAASGRDVSRISRDGSRDRRHLDLVEDNRNQLIEAGVLESQIYDCGRCTHCEWERFYSYRREGLSVGRLMGAIGIR